MHTLTYTYFILPLTKIIELAHFMEVHLAVNKLITDKMQNIFSLISEYSGFI